MRTWKNNTDENTEAIKGAFSNSKVILKNMTVIKYKNRNTI